MATKEAIAIRLMAFGLMIAVATAAWFAVSDGPDLAVQKQAMAENDLEFAVANDQHQANQALVNRTRDMIFAWGSTDSTMSDTKDSLWTVYSSFLDSLRLHSIRLEIRWRQKRDSILGYWTAPEPPKIDSVVTDTAVDTIEDTAG